jgi:hypothetical protein
MQTSNESLRCDLLSCVGWQSSRFPEETLVPHVELAHDGADLAGRLINQADSERDDKPVTLRWGRPPTRSYPQSSVPRRCPLPEVFQAGHHAAGNREPTRCAPNGCRNSLMSSPQLKLENAAIRGPHRLPEFRTAADCRRAGCLHARVVGLARRAAVCHRVVHAGSRPYDLWCRRAISEALSHWLVCLLGWLRHRPPTQMPHLLGALAI